MNKNYRATNEDKQYTVLGVYNGIREISHKRWAPNPDIAFREAISEYPTVDWHGVRGHVLR